MKYKGLTLETPLCLPPHKVGKFELAVAFHKKGDVLPVVTLRNSLLMGMPHHSIKLTKNVRIHQLLKMKNGGTVTSDSPQELFTQQMSFHTARGRVLVGGLGIGMASTMIANMKGVKSVDTVEIEPDVIKLVEKHLPKTKAPSNIILGDVYEIIRCGRIKFDYAYLDIWSGTNEGTWDEHVVPLKRLIAKEWPGKTVTCWMEREMKTQIIMSLMNVTAKEEPWIDCWRPKWVFQQALKRTKLPAQKLVRMYVDEVGSPIWEKLFPWDEYKKPQEVGA
jgi:hypothetical protein